MLSANTKATVDEHAAQFREATPFRHVVIPEFLDAERCRQLQADFPSFDKEHALNEMGEVGGKAVRMDVREISQAYRDLDRWLQTSEFLDYVSHVTGIPDLLYDPDYIGGGTHENRHGQGLDAHVDFNYHPRTQWHRRLNLIVYLNDEWEERWGGCLDLHADPWNPAHDRMIRIPPLFNHCAIFETTENSWHGFEEIALPEARRNQVSRKSFAIYLYTRERPQAEAAPPHATIYVPQGIPDWDTGRVLSDSDIRELRKRFTRMRTQLRYLYEREKDFGMQMRNYEYALGEARSAQRMSMQGYAVQSGAPLGLWPDAWAGEDVTVQFTPTRKAKALKLELMVPPSLGAKQSLHIELAGRSWSQLLHPGQRTGITLSANMSAGKSVTLRIHAERTWVPASEPDSGDQRELAYRLVSASLEH